MPKAVKLADIAKEVGVSVVTVSKALSNQKGVSEEMRERIVKVADELGYKKNTFSANKTQSSKTVGILMHEKYFKKYNSFYLEMYQILSSELVRTGDFGMLEIVERESERELLVPNLLKEAKADALILLGEFSGEYITSLKEKFSGPVIFLDFSDEKQGGISVISDSFYGAYYLTNYLFDHGHKDIAFVGSLLSTKSITDRYLGYVKSMMEHGISVRPDWQIEDRDKTTGVIFEADKLTLPVEMPTAFVCDCDLAAGVLIKRLEKEGYSVPEDFSVVGYDNFIFPGVCDVEITTYEVDMKTMVEETINLMNKALYDKDFTGGIHIVSGHLVEKESVKKI